MTPALMAAAAPFVDAIEQAARFLAPIRIGDVYAMAGGVVEEVVCCPDPDVAGKRFDEIFVIVTAGNGRQTHRFWSPHIRHLWTEARRGHVGDYIATGLRTWPSVLTVNTIDAGNLGGTKLVDINATSLDAGAVAAVYSVGALFELVKTPSAALINPGIAASPESVFTVDADALFAPARSPTRPSVPGNVKEKAPMPPIGRDEQVQAIHALSVVESAQRLVAEIARSGGIDKLDATKPGVRDALTALFEETTKLSIYQARASARGTIGKLDDEKLALAVKDVRDNRQLSVDEEEVRDMTAEETDKAFSVDDAVATAETEAPPAPKTDEEAFAL